MGPKLLSLLGVKYLFSERLCQDTLESFFGKQRAIGKFNCHPTTDQYLTNCNILRIVHMLGLDPILTNTRGHRRGLLTESQPDVRRRRRKSA